MNFPVLFRTTTLAWACLLLSHGALADSVLDSSRSSIQFVSVKNSAVAEVHHFGRISGTISKQGEVSVLIALVSVETMIPIRNERMRELLFNTTEFPGARLSASVDPVRLDKLAPGQQMTLDLAFDLELHGMVRSLQAAVKVSRLDDAIEVTTLAPLIINAADFDLDAGVAALQAVAGLNSISTAVPVTARLVFSD